MRYLLQRPLPDEILTSALVRTCVRFDLAIKPLLDALGVNPSAPSFFHMSNIATYAQVLRIDPVKLLHQSTVFPTLVAFQPGDRRKAFQAEAIHGAATQAVRLSALQSTRVFVPFRRLCSACVRADKKSYGLSYWHLSHQLPGVTLCAHHGTRLRITTLITASGRGRWSYQLPEEVDSAPLSKRPAPFDIELNRLALNTQAGDNFHALGPVPERFYRQQLERAGLVSADRQVNACLARDWIAGHLRGLGGSAGLLQVDPTLSWVDLILRERPGIPFPACKHLIIQAALASTPRPTSPYLDHKSTGYRGKDVQALDLRSADRLDARLRSRLDTGDRFTLREELVAVGVWQGFRHNRLKYPAVTKVVEQHRTDMLRMKNRRTTQGTAA